jgi:hypothetical protein
MIIVWFYGRGGGCRLYQKNLIAMKKHLLFVFILCLTMSGMAQNAKVRPHHNNGGHHSNATTLTIVAPWNQSFWLFIDDVLQNQDPVHSICIQNLRDDEYYIRVELDNELHNCAGQFVDTRQPKTLSIVQNWKYYGLDEYHSPVRPDLTMNLVIGQTPYSGNVQPIIPPGPPMPQGMKPNDYNEAVRMISNESFDDTKLALAKQIISSNPMTVNQIVNICKLFSFESKKLEFAKFAYSYCTDRNKYYLLNEVFTYDSSKRELNEFIQGL